MCEKSFPGTVQSLSGMLKMNWPPPTKSVPPYPGSKNLQYFVIGRYFLDGWGNRNDAAAVILEDGAVYWGAADSTSVEIGLATRRGDLGVDWDKAIAAFNICDGMYQEIRSGHQNPEPVFMKLRLVKTSTIVLRKPEWFGWWTDKYHMDPVNFWAAFGGKRATFFWVDD